MNNFKYKLDEVVTLKYSSSILGTIVGRAEYVDGSPNYLVVYQDMQGNPKREWFVESEIV